MKKTTYINVKDYKEPIMLTLEESHGTSCVCYHFPHNDIVPFACSTEWHEYWKWNDDLGVYISNVSMN